MRRRRARLLTALLLSTACGQCLADRGLANPRADAAQRLQQAEKLRAAQDAHKKDIARNLQDAQVQGAQLADQRVRAAATLRATEDRVVQATARLDSAQAAQAQADAALKQRAAAFSALVPLMLRMSRYPAETVLAIPVPPDVALEGLLLTKGVAASLNREAAALREAERQAAALQRRTGQEAATLAERRRVQEQQAAALDRDVAAAQARISAAEAEAQQAAQRAAALAAQAQTLRDAITAMDTARAQAAAKAAQDAAQADKHQQTGAAQAARVREAALSRPALGQAAGRMVAPVAGSIVKGFGSPEADGPSTGIVYGVAPSAFVASPCAGRVGFAAPFRSYGQLVIVECAGGYDWVLAGLEKIAAKPGSAVKAGEPIGRMPDFNPGTTAAKGSRPGLYVELRSHGEPVNPVPFLNVRG